MSLKSSRYPSNNTSFRSPQFTKMPGTGGTGAYGDVSDGEIYVYGKQTGFVLDTNTLSFIAKHHEGNNIAIAGGGAYAKFNIKVDGTEYPLQIDNSWSHSDSTCVFCSWSWIWNITQQGKLPIQIIQYITGGNGDTNNRNFAGYAFKVAPTNTAVQGKKSENKQVMKYFSKSISTWDNSFQWHSCVGWR